MMSGEPTLQHSPFYHCEVFLVPTSNMSENEGDAKEKTRASLNDADWGVSAAKEFVAHTPLYFL